MIRECEPESYRDTKIFFCHYRVRTYSPSFISFLSCLYFSFSLLSNSLLYSFIFLSFRFKQLIMTNFKKESCTWNQQWNSEGPLSPKTSLLKLNGSFLLSPSLLLLLLLLLAILAAIVFYTLIIWIRINVIRKSSAMLKQSIRAICLKVRKEKREKEKKWRKRKKKKEQRNEKRRRLIDIIGLIEKYVHQAACDSFHSWLKAVREKISLIQIQVRNNNIIFKMS